MSATHRQARQCQCDTVGSDRIGSKDGLLSPHLSTSSQWLYLSRSRGSPTANDTITCCWRWCFRCCLGSTRFFCVHAEQLECFWFDAKLDNAEAHQLNSFATQQGDVLWPIRNARGHVEPRSAGFEGRSTWKLADLFTGSIPTRCLLVHAVSSGISVVVFVHRTRMFNKTMLRITLRLCSPPLDWLDI